MNPSYLHIIHFVHCELTKYFSTNKWTFLLLCISNLISCYIFQINCHHQGAYTDIAKTYSDKTVLHCLCISNIQIVFYVRMIVHRNELKWIKPTDALNSNFIGIATLHVSGSLSAHHQEFWAVRQFWYIICCCGERMLPGVGWHMAHGTWVPSYSW